MGHLIICSAFTQPITHPYNFPIKPGTTTWASLKTEKERHKALQIPDSLIKRMTTDALIKTCINYPAFGYYMAYDNMLIGIRSVTTQFNGFQELLNRKDSLNLLLQFYKNMQGNNLTITDSDVNSDYWSLKVGYIELIIAQDEVINSMSDKEKYELVAEAKKKYKIKLSDNDSIIHMKEIEPTLLIMGRVIQKADKSMLKINQNNRIKGFVESANKIDALDVDNLLKLTDEYLTNNK